jgi:hypothetical protein
MGRRLAGGVVAGLSLGIPVGRELAAVLAIILHMEQLRPFPAWLTFYASWAAFAALSVAVWVGLAYLVHRWASSGRGNEWFVEAKSPTLATLFSSHSTETTPEPIP